ncbi:hypothetical protein C3747_158g74 [Trypanosoma cruzi]|uniref:Uncharacterized protein n=2 Tax=Trypanosoma cruzi TaxID=5693 RepID=Q4CZZ3_TRYCC|nr:hypothetical protein, conserved [Trypanosoma cruzi]EAN85845.1 hypothetical protein, conserved [Trypanosoma cruzi]PWV04235.1 hypothetical protein C3747_158g74 [Trypanosoma cruzi]|eukprot:XP_807696.1 hypothetical protein [Trypanosoma cruzi strain CL Brener]
MMSTGAEVEAMREGVSRDEAGALEATQAVESALQRYRSHVRGKILGEALVESSTLAAAALEEMTQSHARTVEELNAQIAGLQEQMFEAAAVIEALGGKIAGDTNTSSSPSVARRSFALDVCTTSREKGDESTWMPTETEELRLTEEKQQRLSSLGESTSDAFHTAQSGSRGTGRTAPPEIDATHSALYAELLQCRGTLKLQQQQQASMETQLKELTALLSRVVKENATYRQEIQLLRATTIPVEEHRQILHERDTLEQECRYKELELQHLKEELETALNGLISQPQEGTSLLDLGVIHEGAPVQPSQPSSSFMSAAPRGDVTHGTGEKDTIVCSSHISTAEGLASDPSWNEEGLQHAGLWKTAIRELEQQAVLAASQLSAAERLREAESRIEELEAIQAELRTSLETLEAEDKCVREDCGQLVFRNAVLSQQVASLLVRVERQRRALERQEKMNLLVEEGDAVSDSEILLAGEEPLRPDSRRAQRGRVASAVQSLLERRRAVSAFAPSSPSAGGAAEVTRGGGNGRGSFLDMTLQPAEPLEVEGGLRTGLGVFARNSHRPRRSLALRNLGSPSVEVDFTRVPQLPATDQLTGVALGRPSHYATLDPARLMTADNSSGSSSRHTNHNDFHSVGSSGSATKTLFVSDNTEENRQFLELLREDENLDRYSINSVAELLQRNQELLQQLYVATKRAESAERRHQERDSEENVVEEGESRAASDVEAAQPHRRVRRKRSREEVSSTELHSQQRQKVVEEEGESGGRSTPQRHTLRHGYYNEEGGDERRQSFKASDDRYVQLEEHLDGQIDAVLRNHESQLILTDNGLAASLLRIMELGRKPGDGYGSSSISSLRCHGSNTEEASAVEATTNIMKDAVVTSLVRLCTELGVQTANQAVTLASVQQSEHAEMMQKCWAEAQRVLLRSAADLQAAVASLPHPAQYTEAKQIEEVAIEGAGGRNETDEVQLLQSITSLLRTASLKEHSIQRVLQLAARRQRAAKRVCGEQRQEADNDDDDDDLDNDQHVLRQLKVQLEGVQTQYEKLLAAHHEERRQHTALLDRMWRMEEEKLDAVRSRDEALERMTWMMTREEYEATVDALDAAKTTIEDLEAQLRYAQETNNQQLAEVDRWRQVSLDHERQREEDAAIVATQLAEKDRLIAQFVQQHQQIESHNSELLASICRMEANATQQRDKIASQDDRERALREQLRRAELALLEQQCTQDLLFAIFPGDRALEENRNLIQVMRAEKERLAETVASLQLELEKVHRDLASARLQIHAAEQARQEAELQLHEVSFSRANVVPAATLSSLPTAEGMPTTTTTTASATGTVELELLQRTNASLLAEKRGWTEREALLREQLAALGRDPVSENARRYGLKATRSFEEQLVEMDERCLGLQTQVAEAEKLRDTVDHLTKNVESLTTQLDAARNALAMQQESNETLQEEMKTMAAAIQQKEESHDAVKLTLAEKEELISSISGAISTLEKEVEKMDERLRASDEERQRLYQDNVKLIENVAALMEDVKKKEAERKAAQAALAQGLASASSSSYRWRGRSAGSGTPGPKSITGSLGKAPN